MLTFYTTCTTSQVAAASRSSNLAEVRAPPENNWQMADAYVPAIPGQGHACKSPTANDWINSTEAKPQRVQFGCRERRGGWKKRRKEKKEKRDRRNNPSLFNPTLKAALHHVFQKLSHEECTPMMSLRDFFLESRDYGLHGH